jgi:hypothetical protein
MLWLDYKRDRIGLITAALSTEAALEYGLEFINIYAELFRENGREIHSEEVYAAICGQRHPDEPLYPNDGLPYNVKLRSYAELTLLPEKLMLQEFREQYLNQSEDVSSTNAHSMTNPAIEGAKNETPSHDEKKAILFQILQKYMDLERKHIKWPIRDTTGSLFIDFLKSGEIPLTLVFATQMFLEVR